MGNFLIFLVLLMHNTDKPTIVLMAPFETAKECNHVLDMAPKDQRDRFACIRIDMKPDSEGTAI
jgi:hypothetical protein